MSPAERRTTVAAGLGGLVLIAVLAVPDLRFAYRSPAGHVVVETAVTMVAGLVALLLYGRYRRSSALGELLLVYGMSLLSLTALLFVTLPVLIGQQVDVTAASWAALVLRIVGALLILGGALVPARTVYRVAHPAREVVGIFVVLLLVSLVTLLVSSRLPDTVAVRFPGEESGHPVLREHPVVLAAQLVNLVCYAVASVVFTRRAARDGDEMLGWFGAGAALGAWARVAYVLFPSLYTQWLYVGDLLRLGMYVLLLVGSVREIRAYWEAQTTVAVEAERRRLARDLHDGVVQELGYIRSETRRAADDSGERIAAAADRALDEARRAITALSAAPDQPLAEALRQAASEVGDRFDVPVELSLDDAVAVTPAVREELVRIVREAVTNAARHSLTRAVSVTLSLNRLEIADGGRGFDPSVGRPGGFGLQSMRERAESINAKVGVESAPGRGTKVTVTW